MSKKHDEVAIDIAEVKEPLAARGSPQLSKKDSTDAHLKFMMALSFWALVGIQVSVGFVYKYSGTTGTYAFSPAASLTSSEFIKFLLSAIFLFYEKGYLSIDMSVLPQCAVLALGYAINNLLSFQLFLMVHPGTMNVSKSAATIITAVMLFVVFGQSLSQLKWAMLLLQVIGLSIIHWQPTTLSSEDSLQVPAAALLLLCCAVTLTSINGLTNSRLLKRQGVLLNQFNFMLYAFGTLFNALAHTFAHRLPFDPSAGRHFLEGWSLPALGVLACNAFIGIAVSAVYKYAGVITKTFASAFSTAILFVLGFVFGWGQKFHWVTLFRGCAIVFIATFIYLQQPADTQQVSDHARRRALLALLATVTASAFGYLLVRAL